jgi:hypothetical protein
MATSKEKAKSDASQLRSALGLHLTGAAKPVQNRLENWQPRPVSDIDVSDIAKTVIPH